MVSSKSFKCRLKQGGIVVCIGNAGGDNDEHLIAYAYNGNGPSQKDTVECRFDAVLGERFCVHWGYEGKAVKTGRGLRGIVLLDGIKVGGGLLPPESVRNCEELELTGHQQRGNVERPFIFRQREETDTASIDDRPMDKLAMIEVVVFWVWVDDTSDMSTGESSCDSECEDKISRPMLQTKMKVRYEFVASLGAPEPSEALPSRRFGGKVDNRDYRFLFHYAPKGCAELQAGKLPINQPGSEESFEPTIQNSALPRRSQRLLCGLSRRHAQEPLSTLRLNRGLGVGRKNPALEAHGSDNHALDNARHEKSRPTSGRVLLHKPRRKWPTQDDPIEVGDDESIKGIPKPPPNKRPKIELEDAGMPTPKPDPSSHPNNDYDREHAPRLGSERIPLDRQHEGRATQEFIELSSESDIEILEDIAGPSAGKQPRLEHKSVEGPDSKPGPPGHTHNVRHMQYSLDARASQLRNEAGVRSALNPDQAEQRGRVESDYHLVLRLSQLVNEYQSLIKELIRAGDSSAGSSLESFQAAADRLKKDAQKPRRRIQDLKDGSVSHIDRLSLILEFEQLLQDAEDLSSEAMSSFNASNRGKPKAN